MVAVAAVVLVVVVLWWWLVSLLLLALLCVGKNQKEREAITATARNLKSASQCRLNALGRQATGRVDDAQLGWTSQRPLPLALSLAGFLSLSLFCFVPRALQSTTGHAADDDPVTTKRRAKIVQFSRTHSLTRALTHSLTPLTHSLAHSLHPPTHSLWPGR